MDHPLPQLHFPNQVVLDLEELWLSFNQISRISNLDNLPQLKKLGLAHNRIQNIDGLSGLVNLEFLDLQANYLERI